ncbi:activating transcription factor 3 isoform X2 [Lycorma delicatula]|uniref:activating transcription factor 3 isoform X2 n=1 Tax=Lycorma delicatula TaxID=130591 RepID=UPI003F511E01
MYKLNMSGTGAPGNLLSVTQGESSCTTPRTPEILNSLIAMINPLDSYRGGAGTGPRLASSPPSVSDTNSTSSSGSPSCMSPPSVQHTCSQLIKEGLKHTIQTKRRNHIRPQELINEDINKVPRTEELTPEDEERRRRRRERNKIAATKCRLKKRERTVNLVQESEILENQNHDLKSQIQELETQRRRLVDMLSVHRPSCTKQTSSSNTFASTEISGAFHNLDSGSFSRSSSASVEETTSVFRRVNMASNCSRPVSTSVIDSSMTYRRVEISSEYQRPASVNPKDISVSVYEESAPMYNRPSNFQTYDDEDVIKDSASVWRSNSGASIDTQFGRISTTDSGYSCQPSLTSLDSPMPYIQSDDGSPYSRATSSVFSRPTSLDVTSDYDSNAEVMDSPTIPPAYHHFDESDNFCAGFPPDRGCIS